MMIGYLPGVDIETFELLGRRYGRDGDRIWYLDSLVDGADAASFEVLDEHFAQDRNSVFFMNKKIPDADRQSFRILPKDHGVDVDGNYKAKLRGGTFGF